MSNKIEDLQPDVADKCRALVEAAELAGIPIRVTHTLRSLDEQMHLYAKGRSVPGAIVTKAKPGFSWHNFGRAFDVCFAKGPDPYVGPWDQLGFLGEEVGLVWGGRFKSFKDRPHFEDHGGTTLAALRAEAGIENLA